MRLADLDPDRILGELEARGEAYVNAKARASALEQNHATAKAAAYNAIRKADGCSVEDARSRALENETVIGAFAAWAEAEREKDIAYLALERARIAVSLFQTVRADLRKI